MWEEGTAKILCLIDRGCDPRLQHLDMQRDKVFQDQVNVVGVAVVSVVAVGITTAD